MSIPYLNVEFVVVLCNLLVSGCCCCCATLLLVTVVFVVVVVQFVFSLLLLCGSFSSIDVVDPFKMLRPLNSEQLFERCLRCTKFSPDIVRDVDANERLAVATAAEKLLLEMFLKCYC